MPAKSKHAEVYIHTLTYIKLSKSRQRRQSLFKRVFTVLLEKSENMNTKEKKITKLCLSEDTAEKFIFFTSIWVLNIVILQIEAFVMYLYGLWLGHSRPNHSSNKYLSSAKDILDLCLNIFKFNV